MSLMDQQIVSVAQAARYFRVDQVTIRRWIRRGCPCFHRGQRGPGRGSRLDLQEVAQWLDLQRVGQGRGVSNASEGMTVDGTLQQIASALCEALIADRADIRAGIDRVDCAEVLVVAFERCCREFGKTYRFDQKPEAIRTLLSFL